MPQQLSENWQYMFIKVKEVTKMWVHIRWLLSQHIILAVTYNYIYICIIFITSFHILYIYINYTTNCPMIIITHTDRDTFRYANRKTDIHTYCVSVGLLSFNHWYKRLLSQRDNLLLLFNSFCILAIVSACVTHSIYPTLLPVDIQPYGNNLDG